MNLLKLFLSIFSYTLCAACLQVNEATPLNAEKENNLSGEAVQFRTDEDYTAATARLEPILAHNPKDA